MQISDSFAEHSQPPVKADIPNFAPVSVDRPAWRDKGAWARFLIVVVLGLSLDLWSKDWAFDTMHQGGRIPLIPHVLEFQTMLNKGALFGIGAGLTEVFLIASGLALVLVAWMFATAPARRWGLHIALGGIVAGTLGNFYDRTTVRLLEKPAQRVPDGRVVYWQVQGPAGDGLTYITEYPPRAGGDVRRWRTEQLSREVGFVRDFIKIPTKLWGEQDLWPWVFNVADSLLVGGVILLGLHMLRDARPKHPPDPASARADARATPSVVTPEA